MMTSHDDGEGILSNRRGLGQSSGGDSASLIKQSPVAGSGIRALKLFRAAVKAIIHRSSADDAPKPRRRTRGETDKGFRHAAPALLRRAARAPVAVATAYLFNFHDWMQLHGDNMDAAAGELDGQYDFEQTHFHPHL
jgi:hypothetical protein